MRVMLNLLEKVAERRIKENSKNFDIQLSSTLMAFAIAEKNTMLPPDKQIAVHPQMSHFTHDIQGIAWGIHNRAYRDNTNDQDVEEAIYMCL